jgi:hypothetical protein
LLPELDTFWLWIFLSGDGSTTDSRCPKYSKLRIMISRRRFIMQKNKSDGPSPAILDPEINLAADTGNRCVSSIHVPGFGAGYSLYSLLFDLLTWDSERSVPVWHGWWPFSWVERISGIYVHFDVLG